MQHLGIRRDPKAMMRKPVIVGRRISVEHIRRCLAAGDSIEHILDNRPHVPAADIRAAHLYAADHLAHQGIATAE